MLSDLLNQTVTVVSRTYDDAVDAYGNQTSSDATTETLAYLQQLTGSEQSGYVPEATDLLIVPSGTAITADDVVIDEHGLRYEVIGPPSHLRNPRTRSEHHIEATLKRTAGAMETS